MVTVGIDAMTIVGIAARLNDGATLVYPTETCYGLGCDATNATAVERLFAIKERQKDKPMLVLMADQRMARRYVQWSPVIQRLADRYWPGPLTIVAPVSFEHGFADGVLGSDGMLAFRVTDHPFAHALCEALDKPLVSTSANVASLESPYDMESIHRMFDVHNPQPDMVIDAGTLPFCSPSTIVRVVGDRVEVLRQGDVIVEL